MLYHGTNESHLPKILKHGIQPRRHSKNDNWEHSVSSNSSCVYLSIAYPLYFANAAIADEHDTGRLMVLEIDDDQLLTWMLCADEDFLAQANANPKKRDLPMKEKNEYYKKVMHRYSHTTSLEHMGNCAYRGSIPKYAITRVAFIEQKTYAQMVMRGYDPSISTMNYMFRGHNYRQSTKWLFNPEAVEQEYLEFPINGKMKRMPQIPILEDRKGIEVVDFSQLLVANRCGATTE